MPETGSRQMLSCIAQCACVVQQKARPPAHVEGLPWKSDLLFFRTKKGCSEALLHSLGTHRRLGCLPLVYDTGGYDVSMPKTIRHQKAATANLSERGRVEIRRICNSLRVREFVLRLPRTGANQGGQNTTWKHKETSQMEKTRLFA